MTRMTNIVARCSTAAIVGFATLSWSGDLPSSQHSSLISSAHAVIGRPLTPVSYAGVARRTTRRAVVGGAVVAAPVVVVPAPVVVAPAVTCVQVVNSYGQITRVCR
jgi:hypothetical protein